MTKAVFPGSFDPPTYGHLDIIVRGASLFDSFDVVVADNKNKTPVLPALERKNLIQEQVEKKNLSGVHVVLWDGLIVDYCKNMNVSVLVRGVRSASDFDYEFELAMINKNLNSHIETVLLPGRSHLMALRSRTIRELLAFGGNLTGMVPPEIEESLKNRMVLTEKKG